MRHLIIGTGQVGSALFEVLKDGPDEVWGIDEGEVAPGRFHVIHICFPYGSCFNSAVERYSQWYGTKGVLVIIHSSVKVGTSRIHGAVHSPIRGVHPNLARGIRTFTKFFGGWRAQEAAQIFRALEIECYTTELAENTEALKLWDTTYYGWNIVFEKAVKKYCETHGLDFNIVYTEANLTYNEGYRTLGMPNVQRPVLKDVPGNIGGHCVIPNAKLLGTQISDIIRLSDAQYEYATKKAA